MQRKRKKRGATIWILSILNAFFMLGFAYYWLSLPYTFGDEAFLIKWSSLTKKSLFGFDPKPSPEEVLFVNVSNNKTIINGLNEFGEPSPYHRKVITDRQHLAEFFELLTQYEPEVRFVLCDVLFEDSTQYDSRLGAAFAKLGDKLLGVSHLNNDGRHILPIVAMAYAPATYYTATEGLFLKFPLLLGDSLRTAPLIMHQKINQVRFQKGKIGHRLNGRLSLPSPITDFKVRNSDFRIGTDLGDANFAVYEMGTIIESQEFMSEEDLGSFFRGKLILIGDFKEDLHLTPFGKMPGLLVLYNAYLTLVSGQNAVRLSWIIYLLIAFALISYRVFSDVRVSRPAWLLGMFKSKLGQAILNSLDEFVLLTLTTLFSYFLFNIHINILILLIYIKMIEFIWKKAGLHKRQSAALEEVVTT